MLHRSSPAPTDDGPLIANAGDLPASRRRRSRKRVVVACAGVGLLALAAGAIAAISLFTVRTVPAPSLTPIAGTTATPSPEPAPEAGVTTDGVLTDVLSGQNVWLALPAGDAQGVAYLLPDAADDPEALLQDAAAGALLADGWAVATGDLNGLSWGSPASTTSLAELRAWVDAEVGALPALYVGAGMGSTTALTSLARQPALPVACWYAIAPITDLATAVGAAPSLGDQIAAAWGGIPSADQNPVLLTAGIAPEVVTRVVIPATPQVRIDDANGFIAALEDTGHIVSSVAADPNATPAALTDDLISFSNGCRP